MRLVQQIKMIWQRREVRLLLVGVLLVMVELWLLARLNNRGPVTLEFVGYERRGTNNVDGTIVAFRISNHSGSAITYSGLEKTSPVCEVVPMVADKFEVVGGTIDRDTWMFTDSRFRVVSRAFGFPKSIKNFEMKEGEERIVYALVGYAEQSWSLKMNYKEGTATGAWVNQLPKSIQNLFRREYINLPENTITSKPVHRLVPWNGTRGDHRFGQFYFMTEHRTNRNGRVTAKMTSVKVW